MASAIVPPTPLASEGSSFTVVKGWMEWVGVVHRTTAVVVVIISVTTVSIAAMNTNSSYSRVDVSTCRACRHDLLMLGASALYVCMYIHIYII